MKWHIDNDIVIKLATLDVVNESISALGLAKSDIRVLPTAQYKLHTVAKRDKGEAKYGKLTHQRIAALVNTVATVGGSNGKEHIDRLTGLPNVDAGELILVAETAANLDSMLITGDKRSLRAIAGDRRGVHTVQAIAGRVVCFEQVILAVLDKHGFEPMIARLVGGMSCDGALKSACDGTPSEATVVAKLSEYVGKLRQETGVLLKP